MNRFIQCFGSKATLRKDRIFENVLNINGKPCIEQESEHVARVVYTDTIDQLLYDLQWVELRADNTIIDMDQIDTQEEIELLINLLMNNAWSGTVMCAGYWYAVKGDKIEKIIIPTR